MLINVNLTRRIIVVFNMNDMAHFSEFMTKVIIKFFTGCTFTPLKELKPLFKE